MWTCFACWWEYSQNGLYSSFYLEWDMGFKTKFMRVLIRVTRWKSKTTHEMFIRLITTLRKNWLLLLLKIIEFHHIPRTSHAQVWHVKSYLNFENINAIKRFWKLLVWTLLQSFLQSRNKRRSRKEKFVCLWKYIKSLDRKGRAQVIECVGIPKRRELKWSVLKKKAFSLGSRDRGYWDCWGIR